MPRKLKRYHGRGDLHFITFSCYERRALLATVRARNLFLKILEQVRRRCAASMVGYVVMPEHVHLLLSEPKKGTLAKLLQVLKQRVSRAMRGRKRRRVSGQLSLNFPVSLIGLRRFWQRRYYDFKVYSARKIGRSWTTSTPTPYSASWCCIRGTGRGAAGDSTQPGSREWSRSNRREKNGEEKKAHPLPTPQRVGHPSHVGRGRVYQSYLLVRPGHPK